VRATRIVRFHRMCQGGQRLILCVAFTPLGKVVDGRILSQEQLGQRRGWIFPLEDNI